MAHIGPVDGAAGQKEGSRSRGELGDSDKGQDQANELGCRFGTPGQMPVTCQDFTFVPIVTGRATKGCRESR